MLDIMFRGKDERTGEWLYGWYCEYSFGSWPLKPAIIPIDSARRGYLTHEQIDRATLGQYTGLTDKTGTRIFEGDIIAFTNNDGCKSLYLVDWRDSRWVIRYLPNIPCFDEMEDWNPKYWKVIGNKWDNPELLKEGA